MPLRLLIFDMDGTLYDSGRLRRQLLPRLAAYCLFHPIQGWRTLRILSAWRRSLEQLRRTPGRLPVPGAQLEAALRATGASAAAIEEALEHWFYAAPLPLLRSCIRPGLLELLANAAARSVKCAVLSDYEPTAKLQAMGLADRFHAVLCSEDPRVQSYKPDPAGIRVLLDAFGVAPADALYLGDRLGVDDAAAHAAGVGFLLIGAQGQQFDQLDWSGAAGLSHSPANRPTLAGHLRILRLSHWVKNVFVLPGVIVALALDRGRLSSQLLLNVIWGLLAIGLVASSNYVLNEILDAATDRAHPVKRHRPIPSGQVSRPLAWLQWIVCAAAGLSLGAALNLHLGAVLLVFWLMACVYNIRPLRAKDRPHLDVLLEGFNNPLRMLAGWYLTGTSAVPVFSLLLSYWMAGCYFMAVKRFAEYRMLANPERSAAYRKSFQWYTEPTLLVAILFYASCSMLFFGAFLMRYRLELVVSFPLVAIVMAAYLHMAFEPDSPAQRPEKLYRQPGLMLAIAACAVTMAVLTFVDIPLLHQLFPPTVPLWP